MLCCAVDGLADWSLAGCIRRLAGWLLLCPDLRGAELGTLTLGRGTWSHVGARHKGPGGNSTFPTIHFHGRVVTHT